MNAAPQLRRAVAVECLTVAGFCAYLFYFGLGSIGLVGADEPRYAQIAREMLARHAWVTPLLHGQPWLEKPALYYWLAAISYRIFGVSDWAARLPSAVLASAMVFGVYAFLRRFRRGSELNGALMTASCAGVIGFARAASTDMPLTATFTLGMLAWWTWRESGRRAWLLAFYVCMALGTLAKGPVAPFLAALIVVAFAVGIRDVRLILRTLWPPAVLLYLAVTLPWYIAVQRATGNFFRVFILEHNLERFGTNLYQHPQPFWYYAPVLLLGLVPWIVFALVALVWAVRKRARGDDSGHTSADHLPGYLFLWTILPVVFFSFSQSKLPGYILPSIPAATVLLAVWLQWRLGCGGPKPRFVLAAIHSAVGGLVLGTALLAPSRIVHHAAPREALSVAAFVAALVFVAMVATLRAKGIGWLRFVTLVPVVLALGLVLKVSAPLMDSTMSARPVARELERLEIGSATVALYHARRELEYGLGFYRDQAIPNYDRSEVPPGNHLVIAPDSVNPDEIAGKAGGRRVSHVGGWPPQKLEFYWISPAMKMQMK